MKTKHVEIKGRRVDVSGPHDVEKALKKLKRILNNDKTLQTVRDNEFYTKPSERRKRAAAAAKKRQQTKNNKR
jgi:ribosomal protein S21